MIVTRIREIEAENPEGYAIDFKKMALVARGNPVVCAETEDNFGDKGLIRCIDYMQRHDEIIGMWANPDDRREYDSIHFFADRSKAFAFAKANGQYSIWGHTEMREIII